MPSLITPVKSTLFLPASQKSMRALDGAYASLLHGRSLDFDDLREYQYGDQVRDIDWRATARTGSALVKRHRAGRMHTVLFVVDTGRSMTARAEDETPKRDLAVLATGVLGLLALRHGDDVALVCGSTAGIRRRAPGRSEGDLERLLRTIADEIDHSTGPNDRLALLSYVARMFARRMIVVVITDAAPLTEATEGMLRRLRAQHDVVWVTISDASPVVADAATPPRADVDSSWGVPAFAHADAEILAELAEHDRVQLQRRVTTLNRLEIGHTTVAGRADALVSLLRMLERGARARR